MEIGPNALKAIEYLVLTAIFLFALYEMTSVFIIRRRPK